MDIGIQPIYFLNIVVLIMLWILSAVAAGSALLNSPAGASRLTPPVLPLVVRNPYLSTWLDHARGDPWNRWPMFWTGESVRGSSLALLCARKHTRSS